MHENQGNFKTPTVRHRAGTFRIIPHTKLCVATCASPLCPYFSSHRLRVAYSSYQHHKARAGFFQLQRSFVPSARLAPLVVVLQFVARVSESLSGSLRFVFGVREFYVEFPRVCFWIEWVVEWRL